MIRPITEWNVAVRQADLAVDNMDEQTEAALERLNSAVLVEMPSWATGAVRYAAPRRVMLLAIVLATDEGGRIELPGRRSEQISRAALKLLDALCSAGLLDPDGIDPTKANGWLRPTDRLNQIINRETLQ